MKRAVIIAEAGVNHEGSLDTCLRMVDEAAQAGCDVFKVQVYDPDRLVTRTAATYWKNGHGTQQDAYHAHPGLARVAVQAVAAYCHVVGIDFCASVFHVEDVPWLAELVDVFKVASGDLTHHDLLRAVRATGKPVLLSTGAADLDEIDLAAALLQGETLLHCVLSYPTAVSDVNLSAVTDLAYRFPGHPVGYSDHTLPDVSHSIILAAYMLGAGVFEKHFTLDRSLPGNDHYHSFTPDDFSRLRGMLDAAQAAQGSGGKRILDCELAARQGARRSLTAVSPIPAGTPISRRMVALKRPGGGLPEFPFGRVTALTDILADETITAAMVNVDMRPLLLVPQA